MYLFPFIDYPGTGKPAGVKINVHRANLTLTNKFSKIIILNSVCTLQKRGVCMLSNIIARIKGNIVIINNPNGGSGTGIILDNRGIIVTNSHVVARCQTVGIRTNDGSAFLGRILAADNRVDYAFVFCNDLKNDNPPVLSQRKEVMEGEDVVAIGHPYGYDFTVTKGIISAARREIKGVHFIQTDVPINPGNSGGPLLDAEGEVLGINTMFIYNAQNLSFAVPIRYVAEAYKNLPPEELWAAGVYCCACGKMNEAGVKYCTHCGDDIQPDKIKEFIYEDTGFCLQCKTQNPPESRYCEKCGARLIRKADKTKKAGKSKNAIPADIVIQCPGCGHENKGQQYCKKCGKKLSIQPDNTGQKTAENKITEEMVIKCPGCGHENKGKKHCGKCGKKLSPPDT
jgi:ribosomal protein L40E/DNA-directed RNA polymerase subunit RPC12/RpoP